MDFLHSVMLPKPMAHGIVSHGIVPQVFLGASMHIVFSSKVTVVPLNFQDNCITSSSSVLFDNTIAEKSWKT